MIDRYLTEIAITCILSFATGYLYALVTTQNKDK